MYVLTASLFMFFLGSIVIDYYRSKLFFPYISFVAAYYLFFYGVFPIWAANFVPHLPYPVRISSATAGYVTLYVGAQILGYVGWRRICGRGPPTASAPQSANSPSVMLLAFGAILLHLLFYAFPALAQLPSVPQLRRPLWDFGFAVLSWLALDGRLSKKLIAGWLGLTIVKIGLDLSDGLISSSVFSFFILLAAAATQRRGRYVVAAILCSVLIMSSYGYVKYLNRTVLEHGATNVFAFKPDLSAQSLGASLNAMVRRSAHALVLERVFELTPSAIPYSGQNPIAQALLDHIPRILWSEKPKETMGNAFGKRYGFLGKDDDVTSWNVPWAADFYIADGPFVAVLEALVIGIGISAGVAWMSARANRIFWFGFYAATLFPLFYQESSFSIMTGSLFWIGALLLFAYWITGGVAARWFRNRDFARLE